MRDAGFVTLVGAGPGDPGLLTQAGRAALEKAEVVLFDRLVGDGILALIPDSALKINVGKNKGNHPTPQHEINRLILEHALYGRRVVRLKGGDPYLFGRGAEELELLRENCVAYRVIPGITSAIAVPAYAGIPVTHRDYSSSLHIMTGHGKEGLPPDIPFPQLAKLTGTLVFLMGLSSAPEICSGLLAEGMKADTPAAVIENGARPNQRRIVATLSDLPARIAAEKVAAPAILVIGAVCELAEQFDWTATLPLWGREILVVSSRTTASRLAEQLRELGCGVDEAAGIRLEAREQPADFWRSVPGYSWVVLTSAFGVELFLKGLAANRIDHRALAQSRFATVGEGSARALAAGGIYADFVPERFDSAHLAAGLEPLLNQTDTVLLYRARDGSGEIPAMLQRKDIAFTDVAAYDTARLETFPDPVMEKVLAGRYNAITFSSASAVAAFAAAVGGMEMPRIPCVCIGPATSVVAEAAGMNVLSCAEATLDGMVQCILEHMGKNNGSRTSSETA